MRRPSALLRALAALLLLTALLVGLPALLALTVGNPLRSWPDLVTGDLSDTVLIAVLAAIAYLAWAQFAVAVAGELLGAVVRRRRPIRLPGVLPAQQRLAHALIATVLAAGPLLSPPPSAQAAPAGVPAMTVAAAPATITPTAGTAATSATEGTTQPYVVTAGGPGTYWDLAEAHLGAGERWGEIWDLNRGRQQPDGHTLTDPGLLRPGWTVHLPDPPANGATGGHRDVDPEPVLVTPGDTLSGIAAAHDVADWHRLWTANAGRTQPGGKQFTDPDHIEPGWTINLPAAEAPPPGTQALTPGVLGGVALAGQTPSLLSLAPSPHAPCIAPTPAGPMVSPSSPAPPLPTSVAPRAGIPTSPTAQPVTPTDRASGVAIPEAISRPPTQTSPAPAAPTSATDRLEAPAVEPESAPTDVDARAALIAAGVGSGFVAGMALIALRAARRRQRRYRRPGRATPATPISARPAERALRAASTRDVLWLDEALRGLAQLLARDPGGRLPDVVAVSLDTEGADLVLAHPVRQAPVDWEARDGGARWHLARTADTGYDRERRGDHTTPYPALVSVGTTAEGQTWLLDLEHIGTLSLTGDPERCQDLARYMAAELSQNPWPELIYLTLAGLGPELAGLNRERVLVAQTPAEITKAIRAARARVRGITRAIEQLGLDVLPARLLDVAGDTWFPEILFLATEPPDDADTAALLASLAQGTRRSQAVVVTGPAAAQVDPTWRLEISTDGRLRVPQLGIDLLAHRLTRDAARDLAALLGTAEALDDEPAHDARGDHDWEQSADVQGGLRIDVVALSQDPGARPGDVPHLAQLDEEPTSTVLPLPTPSYAAVAATTPEGIAALAPAVPAAVSRQVEDADPTLDADLAAWHDPARSVPKVRLLGPLHVDAPEALPAGRPRRAWNTEVVAYLATRPRGVSAEQVAEALWPGVPGVTGTTRLRQAISIARAWLGQDPDTGTPYLPPATPGTDGHGGTYRIEGVLVDAHLFARLRVRGTTRGADGIADLQAALDLVTGIPFDQQRPGGYAWLADTPLDHEYTAMIVDTAHLVVVHHLTTGDPAAAHAAASVAAQSAPYDDVPLLDLVAACDAMGLQAEAELHVARLLGGHDALGLDDLPPRTAQILAKRDWVEQGRRDTEHR